MCSKQHVFPLLTAKSEGHGDMENSVKKKKYPSHFQADKHRLPLSTMARIQDHLSKLSESGRDIFLHGVIHVAVIDFQISRYSWRRVWTSAKEKHVVYV